MPDTGGEHGTPEESDRRPWHPIPQGADQRDPRPVSGDGGTRRWGVLGITATVMGTVAGITVTVILTLMGTSSGGGLNTSGITGFVGGCGPFRVYAQNRYSPTGAAIRAEPNVASDLIDGVPGNMALTVNGWVLSRPAYPTNTAPWNNGVWFHIANGVGGWVSFAGVREDPTSYAPNDTANGGPPVPYPPKCEGSTS